MAQFQILTHLRHLCTCSDLNFW